MSNITEQIVYTFEMVEEIKKGYITGFMDAEGTIGISKDYVLHVQINQSFKPVLERIDNEFKSPSGIKVHSKEGYDKRGVHHKGAWMWRQFSYDTVPFLKYVQTYSIEKRPQIDFSLKYIEIVMKGSKCGRQLSYEEIQQRKLCKKILEEMKEKTPTEQELRNYENEIKLQSIPKDIREGKQKTIFDAFDDLHKLKKIDTAKLEEVPTKQQNPPMPKYIEIGYLAGFTNGEAYIGISKGKRDSYSLHVTIINTNFDMLKMYENKFGGKIRKVKKDKAHHKDKYHWDITNHNALPFLKCIQPFTIVKREQINTAIEFQEWHNQIRIIKTINEKQKAETYYNKLMDMKKETGEEIKDLEPDDEPIKDPFANFNP